MPRSCWGTLQRTLRGTLLRYPQLEPSAPSYVYYNPARRRCMARQRMLWAALQLTATSQPK